MIKKKKQILDLCENIIDEVHFLVNINIKKQNIYCYLDSEFIGMDKLLSDYLSYGIKPECEKYLRNGNILYKNQVIFVYFQRFLFPFLHLHY